MAKLSLAKLERHLYSAADRLRQEGLDAATYKDYIFGLLFLKRCSDVFDAEHERIVGRRIEQGMAKELAETRYGENPDFYYGFFVPERARWDYLQSRLGDATEPYGSVLDKALGALSEANESLEHVLDHISFMRVQGNKRIVSDDACKDLDWLLRSVNAVLIGEAKFSFLHEKSAEEVQDALKRATQGINTCLYMISGRLGLDHDEVLFGRFAIPVMVRYLDQRGGPLDARERDKLLFWFVQAGMWGRFFGIYGVVYRSGPRGPRR